MRGFIGLEVPGAFRRALGLALAPRRAALPAASWVPAANWHLTLVFLGNLEEPDVTRLDAELAPAFARHRPFELELERCGTFPPGRPARIVWVGWRLSEPLQRLQATAAAVCVGLSFNVDPRPYSPHLTLARCRRPWPRAAAEAWQAGGVGAAPGRLAFRVGSGCLFESVPGRRGVHYEVVRSYPLADRMVAP